MKKLTKFTFSRKLLAIFASIILILGVLKVYEISKPTTALAVGDLTVNWGVPEGNSIFAVNNMAPGQMETRSVIITNNASSTRSVAVQGVKTSETGNISTVLEIVISEGGADIYGGTDGTKNLAQFFTDSAFPNGLLLFDLAPHQTKTAVLKVTFNESAGNEFQAKNVIFDPKIGINIAVPDECKNITFSGDPIFGTSGNDTINGTDGNDLIFAFEGDDVINAKKGDDCVVAGNGDDKVQGQDGNDVLSGGAGRDNIEGHNGDDYIDGGNGDDKIHGDNGDDTLFGGWGKDDIDGKNGNDVIDAGEGNDELRGGNGNDRLFGGAGTDKANGDNGTDSCDAESETSCES